MKHRHWIEWFALVFGGDVEMLTCTAPSGTSDANRETSEDGLALGGKDSGEVAVADTEVAVADGDEVAGTSVVTDFLDYAIEHGIDKGVVGSKVDAIVHCSLASKWVGTVAEG